MRHGWRWQSGEGVESEAGRPHSHRPAQAKLILHRHGKLEMT